MDLLTVAGWGLAAVWVTHAIAVAIGIRRVPDLNRGEARSVEPVAATLTVVVPGCNEEASIGSTLESLLASTGIRLQIIAVNDRSTDRTGEIMERVAREGGAAHSMMVLHIKELPEGWLGKPHALHCAAEQAQGEWILFTDADVKFAPTALARVLQYATAAGSDHVALMPTMVLQSLGERAMYAALQALGERTVRYWRVSDPETRDFFGVGGFNLVRRETYEKIGGFRSLRMEVLEDVSLSWLTKTAGYRSDVVQGAGLARIRWIEGLFGIVSNVEKNGFAMFRYRTALCALACAVLLGEAVIPVVAMAMGGWALAGGVVVYLGIGATCYANRRLSGVHPAATLLFAPCAAVFCFAIVRSMVLTLAHGGVRWRGTHYRLSDLRANAAGWK